MIRESLELLRRLRDSGATEIVCAVSGGKDSLAVLDLCHRAFPTSEGCTVHGFFLWLVEGLECEERFLRAAESRYGMVIHRLPSPTRAFFLRNSVLTKRRTDIEGSIRRDLRWGDIEAIMRSRTGADWFAYGHRITDSLQRRAMIQSSGGILEKPRRIYPIWDWKPRDVFGYLRARNIVIPPMFGSMRHKTAGVSPTDPEAMLFLKQNWPADYEKLVRVFPGIETLIYRDELRAKYEIEENAPLQA